MSCRQSRCFKLPSCHTRTSMVQGTALSPKPHTSSGLTLWLFWICCFTTLPLQRGTDAIAIYAWCFSLKGRRRRRRRRLRTFNDCMCTQPLRRPEALVFTLFLSSRWSQFSVFFVLEWTVIHRPLILYFLQPLWAWAKWLKKRNSLQSVKDSPHLGLKIHKATYRLGPHASKGSLSLSVKLADLI